MDGLIALALAKNFTNTETAKLATGIESAEYDADTSKIKVTYNSGDIVEYTIPTIVGPQGPQGVQGNTGATGAAGAPGADGAIQYTAGEGINISNNTISLLTTVTSQTTAPTAAATDGGIHLVYLDSEPTTKYDGYLYFIKEA